MSILQQYEIPGAGALQQMAPDLLKHTANKYMEPCKHPPRPWLMDALTIGHADRIRRSAFLDLVSSVDRLRKGIFPESYDPLKWEIWTLRERVWHSPSPWLCSFTY